MLISPPFIPSPVPGESDEDFINRAMQGGIPGDGAYPLSFDLNWHGGIHLTAPQEGGSSLPVRAIADGVVAYFREPEPVTNSPEHPLNYRGGWTDSGCIVIRHETEIGEGEQARVVFYSIYMHLSSFTLANIQQGQRVYRKDSIGLAGSIYGQRNKIHFEIISSQDQVNKLIGRSTSELDTTANGRTDSCWGDMHFYIPPEVLFYAERPANPRDNNNTSEIVHRPPHAYFVKMSYLQGQCTMTTYNDQGVQQGQRQEENDYEYNLYQTASTLYPECISAGYELLRFGRVLGPDALQPADAAHWRQISYPGGIGWVNLRSPTVTCYSDADFPHWLGWKLIDDDRNGDSRCQSQIILDLIGLDSPPETTEQRVIAQTVLSEEVIQQKVKRLICKFPTEWSRSGIDTRYAWLISGNSPVLTRESFDRLRVHLLALVFWEDAALGEIDQQHWHIMPKEFIKAFRGCGWLSPVELAQCIPRNVIEQTRSQGETVYPRSSIAWRVALRRANRFSTILNKSLRKYLISSSKLRMSYFLANSIQETTYLSRTSENGGPGLRYAPWYGRGMMQLTWEDNYKRYTKFRTGSETPTFRDILETDLSHAAESAGFYWISTARPTDSALCLNLYADEHPVLQLSDLGSVCTDYSYPQRRCLENLRTVTYYTCEQLESVARGVNTGNPNSTGAVNGLIPRRVVFSSCLIALTETVFPEDIGASLFPAIISRQIQ